MNSQVNEHYLDHVVQLSESSEIQASEDIYSGSGQKLVAKGGRIDARVRDRLLAHKLLKPLETLMSVAGGLGSGLGEALQAVVDRYPLIANLCGEEALRLHAGALGRSVFSPQIESLLRVYASSAPGKLEHAAGVALTAAALAESLPGAGPPADDLLLAALLHDVGELYIDPAMLTATDGMTAQQWKHVATHPIVAEHVLGELPGAGRRVADIVRQHHERLDGFGYPRGLLAETMTSPGRILAAAEMLIGILESSSTPHRHAALAVRLVPGEFDRALVDAVASATRGGAADMEALLGMASARGDDELVASFRQLSIRLSSLRGVRRTILQESHRYGSALEHLALHSVGRAERMWIALSSTGLVSEDDAELRQRLAGLSPHQQLEVDLIARELEWRLGELERQVTIRREQLPPDDVRRLDALIDDANSEFLASRRIAA